MRGLIALVGAVAIAAPVHAAPIPQRADWERFLTPATPSEQVLFTWLGQRPAPDTEDKTGRHYQIMGRRDYPGGVDCYTNARGEISEVLLYLAMGPLYLDSQIQRAATLRTPLTLRDVEQWYGKPQQEATSSRTAARLWTYRFQGDATRTLRFDTLPHSPYVHRVIVSRGAP